MTPVVTWTTLSDSPQPLFWMRKKIRSTRFAFLWEGGNCVLSAKGVFEKVQWVWRERRSVEQSGSSSGVSFGICLIDHGRKTVCRRCYMKTLHRRRLNTSISTINVHVHVLMFFSFWGGTPNMCSSCTVFTSRDQTSLKCLSGTFSTVSDDWLQL